MNIPEIAVHAVPRPSWRPLPYKGCRNVEGKVLLIEDDLSVAMLRFGRDATKMHRLWTRESEMLTLMVERTARGRLRRSAAAAPPAPGAPCRGD